MSGYPTRGSVVAAGQVFNSNTLALTLSGPVPATTPVAWRGLFCFIVSMENDADAATGPSGFPTFPNDQRRPLITDNSGFGYQPPYYSNANQQEYSNFPGGFPFFYKTGVSGKTFMVRGGHMYIVYNALSAGHIITISYPHVAHTMDWLAAFITTAEYIYPVPAHYGTYFLTSGNPLVINPLSISSTFFWQGIVQAAYISSNTGESAYLQESHLNGGAPYTNFPYAFIHNSPDAKIAYTFVGYNQVNSADPMTFSTSPGSGTEHTLVNGTDELYSGPTYPPGSLIRL